MKYQIIVANKAHQCLPNLTYLSNIIQAADIYIMKTRSTGYFLITIFVFLLPFIHLTTAVSPAMAVDNNAIVKLSYEENLMLDLINTERDAHGLKPLDIDPILQNSARLYCKEMLENQFIDHNSPISGDWFSRIKKIDVRNGWELAGENLANAPSVESAFENLMNSDAHKDNLLESRYTHVGIGVIDDGQNCKIVTQQFIAYPQHQSLIIIPEFMHFVACTISAWIASL